MSRHIDVRSQGRGVTSDGNSKRTIILFRITQILIEGGIILHSQGLDILRKFDLLVGFVASCLVWFRLMFLPYLTDH